MQHRILITLASLFLIAPAAAVAQSGEATGHYATRTTMSTSTELADGGMMQLSHWTQVTFADERGAPLDRLLSDCVGAFRVEADESVTHASGSCMGKDAEGNMLSWWWQMTESGTDSCPDMCGAFGLYGGYGSYEGMTGDGSWIRETNQAEGGTGTWRVAYSK